MATRSHDLAINVAVAFGAVAFIAAASALRRGRALAIAAGLPRGEVRPTCPRHAQVQLHPGDGQQVHDLEEIVRLGGAGRPSGPRSE